MSGDMLTSTEVYLHLIRRSQELEALAESALSPAAATGLRVAARTERELASAIFHLAYPDGPGPSCDGS